MRLGLVELPKYAVHAALAFLWLIPAAGLLLVANGRWALPAAAWLAPVFLLRFVRSQHPLIAALAGLAVAVPVCGAAWRGLLPGAAPSATMVGVLFGAATIAPYLIDRLLWRRLRGHGSTLVFPCAAVVVEYLAGQLSPYGTWGSIAYTQARDLPLAQLVSVTGIWGLTFLVAWFASAVNALAERPRETGSRLAALAFVLAFVAVHLAGAARLRAPAPGETVRVAAITMSAQPPLPLADVLRHRPAPIGVDPVAARLRSVRESLFARASREAKAGAQVVFWSEANAVVYAGDQEQLLEEGATLAHDEGIYLGMAFASVTSGRRAYENRFLMIDPEGEIVADYRKARPLPGAEERGGDRHPFVVETPYGRLGGAIGLDADFPALVREAGAAQTDVLLLPASDGSGAAPLHARMAVLRGIENGCAVVRQARGGRSLASDARGEVVASVGHDPRQPTVLLAQVPRQGASTFYARYGDYFAWACLVLLAVFLGFAARPPARERPAPVAV